MPPRTAGGDYFGFGGAGFDPPRRWTVTSVAFRLVPFIVPFAVTMVPGFTAAMFVNLPPASAPRAQARK